MFASSKKLLEQKTNNNLDDVGDQMDNNRCNLSDHLYQRKKRNQNKNRKGGKNITKVTGKKWSTLNVKPVNLGWRDKECVYV